MAGTSSGRKIFISVDGSTPSDRAFKFYLDDMMREGDNVYIVHCPEYQYNIGLPGAMADVQAITDAYKKEQERIDIMMNGYIDKLRPYKVKAQTKLLVDKEKPGPLIVNSATEEKANCVIMGCRGLGKVRRTLLGSVSEYVIHHAPPHCSITTIRDS